VTKFKISIKINSPVEIVYQAFIDSDNMLKWSTDLEEFDVLILWRTGWSILNPKRR